MFEVAQSSPSIVAAARSDPARTLVDAEHPADRALSPWTSICLTVSQRIPSQTVRIME
jgi:hypothetical protein